MKILVIPTTDWLRHPVPNRLNFIFDILAEEHSIFVLNFHLKQFDGFPARTTRCTLVDGDAFSPAGLSSHYLLNGPAHLMKIREIVKREKIDVILSSNIFPSLVANFAGVPVVFDYLDHLEESAAIYYPDSFFGTVVRTGVAVLSHFNLRQAQAVITVTEVFKQYLQTLGVKDVTVIPNGVDTTLLHPVPKEVAKQNLGFSGPVIGYLGSLEYWIDLETVVKALPSLPEVTLMVVGPGLFTDYGETIQHLAADLRVSERVQFMGAVPYAELSGYLSAMDIGLNPRKPMKMNEYTVGGKVFNYLSCGVPVLSSRTEALEQLLPTEISYYDDQPGFISAVQSLLEDPGDAQQHRAVAERFDWHTLAARYADVLKRVAEKKK